MRTIVLGGRARVGRLILVTVTLFVHVSAGVCLAMPPFRPPQAGGGFPPFVPSSRPQPFAFPIQPPAQPPAFQNNNSFQGVQVSPRQNFQPSVVRPNPVFTPNPNSFGFQNQPVRPYNPPPSRPTPPVIFNPPPMVRPQILQPSSPPLQTQQVTWSSVRPSTVKPTVMGWPNPVQPVQSVPMNNPVQRPGVSPAIVKTIPNTSAASPPTYRRGLHLSETQFCW